MPVFSSRNHASLEHVKNMDVSKERKSYVFRLMGQDFYRKLTIPLLLNGLLVLLDSLTANAAGNIQQVVNSSSYQHHQITSDILEVYMLWSNFIPKANFIFL